MDYFSHSGYPELCLHEVRHQSANIPVEYKNSGPPHNCHWRDHHARERFVSHDKINNLKRVMSSLIANKC